MMHLILGFLIIYHHTNLTSYLEKGEHTYTHTIMLKTNYKTLFLINNKNKDIRIREEHQHISLTITHVVWVCAWKWNHLMSKKMNNKKKNKQLLFIIIKSENVMEWQNCGGYNDIYFKWMFPLWPNHCIMFGVLGNIFTIFIHHLVTSSIIIIKKHKNFLFLHLFFLVN